MREFTGLARETSIKSSRTYQTQLLDPGNAGVGAAQSLIFVLLRVSRVLKIPHSSLNFIGRDADLTLQKSDHPYPPVTTPHIYMSLSTLTMSYDTRPDLSLLLPSVKHVNTWIKKHVAKVLS